jgi:hypothetical protein
MTKHKNPNVLPGHEGELLMVVKEFMANLERFDKKEQPYHKGEMITLRPHVDIVMYLDSEIDEFGRGHIKFLFNDKIYLSQVSPRVWLWYFTPWPRGGFIEK